MLIWALNLTFACVNVLPGLSATDLSNPAVFWEVSWWTPHLGKYYIRLTQMPIICFLRAAAVSVTLHSLVFHYLCTISEQCQVPPQGVACTNRPSHQGIPQFALYHWLQPHHSASGKNTVSEIHDCTAVAAAQSYRFCNNKVPTGGMWLNLHHVLSVVTSQQKLWRVFCRSYDNFCSVHLPLCSMFQHVAFIIIISV